MTNISDIRWKEDEDHDSFPPVDNRGGLSNYESKARAKRQGLLSAGQYSPTIHDINWKKESPKDDSWNITRGLKSGLWSTVAVVPAVGAMAAKTVEWEGGAKAMAGAAQSLMAKAEQYRPDTSFGELIEDPSLGGAVDWVLYTIGNFAPSMAVGFGGAGIGAKLFLKNAIKQGIKRGLTKEAAAKAITDEVKKKIALKGARVGIVSSTGALEGGHMFMGDVQRHGIENAGVGKAVALGGLAGLVELGIGGFGKGHMRLIEKYLGKSAKETAKKQPRLAVGMLDEIGRQTGGEAFQELTQEELAILHEAWTATPEEYAKHDHWSKENWLRRAESGAGGGLMGFGGGMITPTGRTTDKKGGGTEETNQVKADIKSGLMAEAIKSGDLTSEMMAPVIERVATQDPALAKQLSDMFAVKETDLSENERRFEEDPLNAENNAEYLDKYIKGASLPKAEAAPKVEIPDFKTTGEAYAFGEKATPEQVEELQRLGKVQDAKYKEFKKAGKLQEAMDEAVKGQFYNEALQKVGGTEQYKKFKAGEAVKPIHELTLDEFEKAGHSPWEITQSQWVTMQRTHRKSLGQAEESGTPAAPFGDIEQFHRQEVEQARREGLPVPENVLAEYEKAVAGEKVDTSSYVLKKTLKSGKQRFTKETDGMHETLTVDENGKFVMRTFRKTIEGYDPESDEKAILKIDYDEKGELKRVRIIDDLSAESFGGRDVTVGYIKADNEKGRRKFTIEDGTDVIIDRLSETLFTKEKPAKPQPPKTKEPTPKLPRTEDGEGEGIGEVAPKPEKEKVEAGKVKEVGKKVKEVKKEVAEPDFKAMPLEGITVSVKGLSESGQIIKVKENAKEALNQADSELSTLQKILRDCLLKPA